VSRERLILVGGGGFCRELFFWAAECHAAGSLPAVGGYLDDTGPALAKLGYELPWLGSITDFVPSPGDAYLLAVGDPKGKRIVHGKLSVRGGTFPPMIHPKTRVVATANVAEGVIFCPGSAAGPDTVLERFVTINTDSGLGHDASVGEFSTLSSRVDLTGGVRVGCDVMIGSGAMFVPKVKIGDGAVIGIGSVVYRSVPAGRTVYAAGAKSLRSRG
jgi:sugar O-acyltransferase (sialic acid O-acetyltransferase NeuD family)